MKQAKINEEEMLNWIIIDCGSTLGATFGNPDFVFNIRKAIIKTLMKTNARVRPIDLEDDFLGWGTLHYDPNFIANILGYSHVVDRYPVTVDIRIEDCFTVHTD